MNEFDGQFLLVVLILGEDAVELDDWETIALHEVPEQQDLECLRN